MLFSIVIPLYNKEGQIANTLRSVFTQTCTDYEIVIVNDGSTDGSAAAVEAIGDPRIRLIHQQNAGVSAARNRGIVEARGQYIALLDADDEWKPEYLATIAELIRRYPDCNVFATNYEFHDSKGKITPTIINKLPFTTTDGILSNYFEVASCSHPPICSISIVTTRTAFNSIGGFPIGIKSGEDLLTWARLAQKYKIAYSNKPIAIYNLGEGYDFAKLPPRKQDKGDPVGVQLSKLLNDNPDVKGLKNYVSHWHKMRASVAVRYGLTSETLYESRQALLYNHKNYKVIPFIILALMPDFLRKKIIALRNYR